MQEQIEQMLEKDVGDVEGLLLIAGDGVGIADDRFVSLVDAESEAADAASVECDETGKDVGVEVLQEEFGGAAIVPAEALLPDVGLRFKQGPQLARGKVPEVEDLELGGDWHWVVGPMEAVVELIGIWARWGVPEMKTGSNCRKTLNRYDSD
jgi:hypothetical protein